MNPIVEENPTRNCRNVPLLVSLILLLGLTITWADGRHTFRDRNTRIHRTYSCTTTHPTSVRAYSTYPAYNNRTSYSRLGLGSDYRSGSRLRYGASRLGYYRNSYYRPDYSPYGNAYTRGYFSGLDFSSYRGYRHHPAYQASPAVYIIYNHNNLVYVPVIYSFGVVEDNVKSPEEMAAIAQSIADRREHAWNSLEAGQTKRALAEFNRLCEDVPDDPAAHVGFAISAALDRNYHTAAWAMRQAFRDTEVVPTELQMDEQLGEKLDSLARRYEGRILQYGGDYADGQFMLGAISYLQGRFLEARTLASAAINRGNRDPSTRNLFEIASEASLHDNTLLTASRGY